MAVGHSRKKWIACSVQCRKHPCPSFLPLHAERTLLYPKDSGSNTTDWRVRSPRQWGHRLTAFSPHLWEHGLGTMLWAPAVCDRPPRPWEKARHLEAVTSSSLNPEFCLPQFQLAQIHTRWGPRGINELPRPHIVTEPITFQRDQVQNQEISQLNKSPTREFWNICF